jgi:hypothetical protein
MLNFLQKSSSETTIRVLFWTIGPLIAAVLTYTTRYFINGDAIAYVEMGEALRYGRLWELANLTYSPGYPVLLGLGQILLRTSPLDELELLRVVNFFCFLLAMGSCELLMIFCRREAEALENRNEALLPRPILSLLCYSMFLLAALDWVKVRLLNPDMLVVATILTCASIILWIREGPTARKYVVLGICCGIGYLIKSFFFFFSGVFFLLAAVCAGSFRKALPRTAVAVLVMLLVGLPLIVALSYKLGRLTTGELGKQAYAYFVSGTGHPFRPILIDQETKTFLCRDSDLITKPSDICYWQEGFVPKFDVGTQIKVLLKNIAELSRQVPMMFLVIAWYLVQVRFGSYSFRSSHPPSFYLLTSAICLAGTGLYCLIHVETRYVAGPLFIGFAALAESVRLPDGPRQWKALATSIVFLGVLWTNLIYSGVDQSLRALQSTQHKPSYKEAFLEMYAVKDFILRNGLQQGNETATLGDLPAYWARYARVQITAEIEAPERFLMLNGRERSLLLNKISSHGIRVVVGKGESLGPLVQEGWQHVTGTHDYYVIFLAPHSPRTGPRTGFGLP